MIWLFLLFLLFTYPAEAAVLTGSIEAGEKFFDLLAEEEDNYFYHRAYIRYQEDITPQASYSLRYELQRREYSERVRFSSVMHEMRGTLTLDPSDRWRYYLYLSSRGRSYPQAQTGTYFALIPEIQVNYYPRDDTTYTARWRYQFRHYPQALERNSHQQILTLTFRFNIRPDLTVNGRYRTAVEVPAATRDELEMEHRISLGFRYVLD